MYYAHKKQKVNFKWEECEPEFEGLDFHDQVRKWTQEGMTAENTVTPIYTSRKDGVLPQFDIRTDRFEIARVAMDKVHKSIIAKREELFKATESEESITIQKDDKEKKSA